MSERDYIETVGHEPPVDDSDERWQWEYRGTRQERQTLLQRLNGANAPDKPFEAEEPPTQEETLFGNAA